MGKIISPIICLRGASERLGKGDEDVELRITSRDELGHLMQNFKKMVLTLRDQWEVIQRKNGENAKYVLNIWSNQSWNG